VPLVVRVSRRGDSHALCGEIRDNGRERKAKEVA